MKLPRVLCTATQVWRQHSTDLGLLHLTVLWITSSWMYRALLARITTLPLLPSSSKSVYFSPMLCLLAHPRVIMSQCILDFEVWKWERWCCWYWGFVLFCFVLVCFGFHIIPFSDNLLKLVIQKTWSMSHLRAEHTGKQPCTELTELLCLWFSQYSIFYILSVMGQPSLHWHFVFFLFRLEHTGQIWDIWLENRVHTEKWEVEIINDTW